MNNLWQNYKKVLNNTFLLEEDPLDMTWVGKRNTTLTAKIYRHKYFLKAHEKWRYTMKTLAYTTTSSILRQAIIFPVLAWILWDLATKRSL